MTLVRENGGRGFGCAALEPERKTLRSRRRRAAYADVMDELDNMVSDFDDK